MNIMIEYLGTKEAGPVFTFGMAKGLQDNGVNVCVILSEGIENKEQWTSTFKEENLYFIKTTPKKKKIFTTSISFINDCKAIKDKFSAIKFDYVIRTFIHPFDAVLSKFVRYTRTANICHDPIPHSSMNPRLAKQYKKQIKNSDDIIVLTKSFISVIENMYGKKDDEIYYMRHGLMSYPHGKEVISTGKKVNFLFFGRIDGYKGLHVLADAYKMLAEKYQNMSLTIAGSGDFTDFEEEYNTLPNTTVVNRYIKEDEITNFFGKENTVVVLPYLDATQSGVIPIAFEYGTPVIASDTGGLKEQLFEGTVGLLFEVGSAESLYKKMESILVSEELYKYQQKQMIEGMEKLQWSYVTAKLLEQLEEKTNEKR